MWRPRVRRDFGKARLVIEMKIRRWIVAGWTTMIISCGAAFAQDTSRVPDLNQGVDAVDASVHAGVEERGLLTPQPSQEPAKLPTTYSRWGFNSSGQPPATQFWPAHSGTAASDPASDDGDSALIFSSPSFRAGGQPLSSTAQPARPSDPTLNSINGGNSRNPAQQQSHLNNLGAGPKQNGSTGPQHLKTVVPQISPQPQADGFSSPFPPNQFNPKQVDPKQVGPNQFDPDKFDPNKFELNGPTYSSSRLFSQATFSSKRDRAEPKKHKRQSQKPLGSNHTGAVAGFQSKPERPAGSQLTNKGE